MEYDIVIEYDNRVRLPPSLGTRAVIGVTRFFDLSFAGMRLLDDDDSFSGVSTFLGVLRLGICLAFGLFFCFLFLLSSNGEVVFFFFF